MRNAQTFLYMETPLRGRSGGHTGAAPTISHVVPCPKIASEVFADGLNRGRLRGRGVRWRLVGAVPVCPPVSPCKGASIGSRCALFAIHKHFYTWKRFLCGWGICSLQMETSPLRMGTCSLRMETSLRGRSGGHTGAAPTISCMACVIRFSENSSPRHKYEFIVAANSLPLHKMSL